MVDITELNKLLPEDRWSILLTGCKFIYNNAGYIVLMDLVHVLYQPMYYWENKIPDDTVVDETTLSGEKLLCAGDGVKFGWILFQALILS